MKDRAEILPLIHLEKKYFAIHVINAIDAVDYDRAVVKELPSGFRLEFEKYAFINEKIEGKHIFRIYLDESLMWMVFISDELKKAVESNGLVGFKFTEV
ncbi:imm11 family protein [Laceyella putida]|uniref:Imm11 family protein n=1 Tax=Laceyella putida TaxID=110101 RepID=A0ABW2RQE8_9BACL